MEVADVNPLDVNSKVYVPVTPVILRSVNLATPPSAATVVVPTKEPPTGPVLIATVTVAVLVVNALEAS